jgi:NADH-quinone oxidoreductase subunit A
MTPTSIAAYLALFATVAFLFVFAALLLGRLLRAHSPTEEKGATYECGEPAVGSSYVRFDLRFYVVALLFIIFDVEVAFFFPWATVFGKATQLVDLNERIVAAQPAEPDGDWTVAAVQKYGEMGLNGPQLRSDVNNNARENRDGARRLALVAAADAGVFFAVLLLGFAYVWRRGDLDWVRPADWRQAKSSGRPGSAQAAVTTH